MICPSCGFEQPAGETCSQCQTPMTPAFKEPPSAEPKQESKPESKQESKKESKQPAPHAEAAKPVAEPPAPPKPSVPPKAEISKPHSEPPRKVEHKEHKEKVLSPAPEKPAQEKKESASGGAHEKLERLERLIVTSTPQIEGRQILAYHEIVSATVFVRGDLVKERLDSVSGEVISIRSSPVEGPFEKARTVALTDLKVEAAKRGANAVVGLTMSQTPGIGGIWLCMVGTAVTLKE